ncbi:pregnancy zone protein-like [Dendronephthya gigantea]|uniref:pregnancy zone protein-like n=1 Tax=Dendronephthya gigantea TaxID=151771 RepID=UPI00106C1918|nr:pregnancy zone protein-like [Dendronephthya gigantea]
MEVKVPDAITSWVANGFAMSSLYGMGISNQATLKAFKPFFAHITMPYSVIRGEEIPITVTVINYMSSCVPIKLELIRKASDFKVTSIHISKMCVCSDEGKSTKFNVIPTKLGHIPITVKATTSQAKLCPKFTLYAVDAVTRTLLVEPEGIKQQYTRGTFFCASLNEKYAETIDLPLPTNIISGSVLPKISLIGDMMGPALTNLDGLLAMPYGCGEQNMAKFAPNIYIMDYLTNTNQITKKIKDDAVYYISSGYQRQLTYKRKSGSYSAFGDSDSKGSMMLTAFVVRSFARARRYVFVDKDQIKHSVEWFRRKQSRSGCFPEYGQVFDRSLQGGLNSELTITAYVAIALLEAGFDEKTSMVSRALNCISRNLDTIQDSYTTSLVSYLMVLADHPKAAIMISRLKTRAIREEDEQLYWSSGNVNQARFDYYHQTYAADVEMTSYALLAYIKRNEPHNELKKIVKWLSKQRNYYGGFSSTQDTCVALQALSEVAARFYSKSDLSILNVSANIKDGFDHNFSVTDNNKLILQRVEIPSNFLPNTLGINASGSGCALLQVSVKYNIPVFELPPAFNVNVSVHPRGAKDEEEETPSCQPLQLRIQARWLKNDVSNMAIVDVKLVSGFTVNEKSLELKLKRNKKCRASQANRAILKRFETEGQHVILYFDEIKELDFSLDITQSTLVKNAQPGVVSVYDYYEPESQGKVMYNITEDDCRSEERGCSLTPCGSNGYCTNTNGSYFCQCASGFTSSDVDSLVQLLNALRVGRHSMGSAFISANGFATSWNSAKDDCRRRGGHLAVPTNTKMNNYLYQVIKRHNLIAAWIGVYRRSGRVFYTVGDEEISYKNWNRWEPNNAGGRENCVEILNRATGKWNDRPCHLSDRHYLCQRCL